MSVDTAIITTGELNPSMTTRLRRLGGAVVGYPHHIGRKSSRSTVALSPLSVVTHLSADRLYQLQGMCVALNGDTKYLGMTQNDSGNHSASSSRGRAISLCVVILLDGRDKDEYKDMRRAVRTLPGVGGGHLIVRVEFCCRHRRRHYPPSGESSEKSGAPSSFLWYPINQLRNRALSLSKTDLVLICDVDFRPCRRLIHLASAEDGCAGLLEKVSLGLNCIVCPAFEAIGSDEIGAYHFSRKSPQVPELVESDERRQDDISGCFDELWWLNVLGSKSGLLHQWDRGRVIPFGSRSWPRGHRATRFQQWKGSTNRTPYGIRYEEGFEPFVIMHRLQVPPFDERFEGYGRNKVIFFYHLHSLGFSFTVHPEFFVVHAPHPLSDSRRWTLGRTDDASRKSSINKYAHSQRFDEILDLYGNAKVEIDKDTLVQEDAPEGRGVSWRWLTATRRKQLGFWSAEGTALLRSAQRGKGSKAADKARQSMSLTLLSTLHARWYKYHRKPVEFVARLESQLPRADSDVTIITHCSASHLDRLEKMCFQWTGVVVAAVIADGDRRVDRLVRQLAAAVHSRVESGGWGLCRLDICLCQTAPGPAARDGLYPINALRNVAFDAARTELVLLLDVDTIPVRGLHDTLSSSQEYDRILRVCRGGSMTITSGVTTGGAIGVATGAPTADAAATYNSKKATGSASSKPCLLVIPALEFVDISSDHDVCIQTLLQKGDGSKRAIENCLEEGVLRPLNDSGRATHSIMQWRSVPRGSQPYEDSSSHSPGYEAYGIFSRLHAPRFDERFRGPGLDKVSYCWHLSRLGWSFQVLPAAFVLQVRPHPPPKNGRRGLDLPTPELSAATAGLFQRFCSEIDRSLGASEEEKDKGREREKVDEQSEQQEEERTCSIRGRRPSSRPPVQEERSYEVLAGMSLLAWGDCWAKRMTDVNTTTDSSSSSSSKNSVCGSGWNLKGSKDLWGGIAEGEANCGIFFGGDGFGEEKQESPPKRMVGRWIRIRLFKLKPEDRVCGILGRSVVEPHAIHGVVRYWIRPHWGLDTSICGKLPGLGMSGEVRFLARWRAGALVYCELERLGQPLRDICKVHVAFERPFHLERGQATLLQLEADLNGSNRGGGGQLSFRAWANDERIYEARVYAEDNGSAEMRIEHVVLHVCAAAANDAAANKGRNKPRPSYIPADQQQQQQYNFVDIGGIEVWGRCIPRKPPIKPPKPGNDVNNELSTVHNNNGVQTLTTRCVGGAKDDSREDQIALCHLVTAALRAEKENLRFVFVASTGRCGTHYLSQLLSTAPGVQSFHEASPSMCGHDMLLSAARAPEARYRERRHKVDAILQSALHHLQIRREQGDAGQGLIYADTSHLFLKAFSDVVMRELAPFFRIDVVVLRRDPAAVLKSRIELGHFCRSQKRSDWLLLPERCRLCCGADKPASCCLRGHDQTTDESDMDGFEALVAYASDVEDQIRVFKRRYERSPVQQHCTATHEEREKEDGSASAPSAEPAEMTAGAAAELTRDNLSSRLCCNKVIETTLESLITSDGVRQMFAELDLEVSEATWHVLRGGATNKRESEKAGRVVPLEYCRRRLAGYCE